MEARNADRRNPLPDGAFAASATGAGVPGCRPITIRRDEIATWDARERPAEEPLQLRAGYSHRRTLTATDRARASPAMEKRAGRPRDSAGCTRQGMHAGWGMPPLASADPGALTRSRPGRGRELAAPPIPPGQPAAGASLLGTLPPGLRRTERRRRPSGSVLRVPGQQLVQVIGERLPVALAQRGRPPGVHSARPQRVHEVAHVEALTDGVR